MTLGVGRVVGMPSSQTYPDGSTWSPLPEDRDLQCDACGATWTGAANMDCPWCVDAAGVQRLEQRRTLLFPDWVYDDGPRYDELLPVDRLVWDRTRGHGRGDGSRVTWAERLGRAVQAGLVTEDEAAAALRRAGVSDG